MIKKLVLGLSLGSVLLSSLLFFMVPPASASSDVAWLNGWHKRVKITINSTNINETLTDFPVLIYLSTNSGENAEDVSFVFDELGTNANRKKIAVTTSNGTDQCYVEIEQWDQTNEQAWLWAKVPNVSSNADTDLYLYYNNLQTENTNWVGDVGESAAESVWDTNFVMVQHLVDDTTSNTLDSTPNSRDGIKTGTNLPQQVDGEISKAQELSRDPETRIAVGTQDYSLNAVTVELWLKAFDQVDYDFALIGRVNSLLLGYQIGAAGKVYIQIWNNSANKKTYGTSTDFTSWSHIVGVYTESRNKIYVNGIEENDEASVAPPTQTYSGYITYIGWFWTSPNPSYGDGVIDEVRISHCARSPAWVKASYESGRDHLLDFGIEENRPIPGTVFSVR